MLNTALGPLHHSAGVAELRNLITATAAGEGKNDMSKHEKQDPEDLYKGNGHKPGVFPSEEPRGKHQKDDNDDEDKNEDEKR